jgi:hypothetical protein
VIIPSTNTFTLSLNNALEMRTMLEYGVAKLTSATPGGFAEDKGMTAEQAVEQFPNLIRGWADDEYLASIIRPTPLFLSLLVELLVITAEWILYLFGWRKLQLQPLPNASSYSRNCLECWVLRPPDKAGGYSSKDGRGESEDGRSGDGQEHETNSPNPLVLIPGAGYGLVSFVPLVLTLQVGGVVGVWLGGWRGGSVVAWWRGGSVADCGLQR